ncbi:MAG: Ig-like domain-containing protein [Candidatus Acidiferrales bacterium]
MGPEFKPAAVTSAAGNPPDGGKVTFERGSEVIGAETLTGGSASLTTSSLQVGDDSIMAVYAGDPSFGGSTSKAIQQMVSKASTTTLLISSQNPSNYEQSVTFTATVSPQFAGTPTGTVKFYAGTVVLGSKALVDGSASYSTTKLAAGTDSITAVYEGGNSFESSTSTALSQVVGQSSTTTTLVSSASPTNYMQSVTFTATVAGQFGGMVTGSVVFTDGASTLNTVSLAGGVARYTTTSLAVGTHNIIATYQGSASFTGSPSAVLTQTVNQSSTTTSLTSSLNPSTAGQSVTFTATVTGQFGGPVTGSVVFTDGATTLRIVGISGTTASYTTSALGAGTHNITATYGGNAGFIGSSQTLTQTVN